MKKDKIVLYGIHCTVYTVETRLMAKKKLGMGRMRHLFVSYDCLIEEGIDERSRDLGGGEWWKGVEEGK